MLFATLPTETLDPLLLHRSGAMPGAQARRAKIRNLGYGVPSDFELNFGRYLLHSGGRTTVTRIRIINALAEGKSMSHHFDTKLAKVDPSLNVCDFYVGHFALARGSPWGISSSLIYQRGFPLSV